MDKLEALQSFFGHEAFREGQETLIDALLAGRDVLGIMPTGGGKSVCYQVPALLLPGTALVISPLISLMKDQVAALKAAGIPAAFLNSALTPSQQELALQRARAGQYRLIYVAPERLDAPSFRAFAAGADISLIAVDEAHCVSQWGQDFRPNYLRIAAFVDSLPKRPPVGAFTATATKRVRDDILRLLALRDPVQTVTGFDRPNLFYEVIPVKRHREHVLYSVLEGLRGRSGIVYCATRKNVETVCERLRARGFSATRYHAGLEEAERRQNQEDFQYDRAEIMVATNAFGMGIDKSNVSFVIHYNMPKSVEAYYQEAGRAGRDGSPSDCVLLFSMQDVVTARRLITDREPNPDLTPEQQREVTRQDLRRLNDMIALCEGTDCFRGHILRYFGQPAAETCGGCSRCAGPRWPEAALIGQSERISPDVRRGLRQAAGANGTSPGKKPSKVRLALEQAESIAVDENGSIRAASLPGPDSPIAPGSPESLLFDRLRAVRLDLARERGVPPYVICHDKTLRDMARKRPRSLAELHGVHGLGDRKIADFGARLLAAVTASTDIPEAPPVPDEPPVPPPPDFFPPLPPEEPPVPIEPPVPPPPDLFPPLPPEEAASGRPWSADEVQRLFDGWYGGEGMAAIARSLGRTRAEVLLKADDMGILGPADR